MDKKPLNEVVFTFKCIESIESTTFPIEDEKEYQIRTNLRIAEGGQYVGIEQNEGARAFYCRILPKEKNLGLKIFKPKRSKEGLTGDEIANYRAIGEAAKREFNFLRDLQGAEGHAPSVFAYGEILREDGSRQWAMIEEHVEGLTLDEYISYASGGDHVSLDAEQALWLGFRIAEACDACYISEHENAQITHRDLSPDNLRFFTSKDGRELDRVVLLDFGNAVQATRQERTPTWMNRDLPKVKYGAPEMFGDNETRNATVSDTWAIGAIMHYARTFQVPFEKNLEGFIGLQVLNGEQCNEIKDIKSHPVDLRAVIREATKDQVVEVRGFSADDLDDFLCEVVGHATLVEVDQAKHNSRPTVSSLYRQLSMITASLDYSHDREREAQRRLEETEKEFESYLKGRQEIQKDFCASSEMHKQRKRKPKPAKQRTTNGWMRYTGVRRNDPCPCGSGKKFKMCHGRFSRWPQVVEQREAAIGLLFEAASLLDRHFEEALLGPTILFEADLNRSLDYGILAKRQPAIDLASNYAKLEAIYEARSLRKISHSPDRINDYLNAASTFRNSTVLLARSTAHSKRWGRFALVAYQLICETFAFYSDVYFAYDLEQFRAATGFDVRATTVVLGREFPSYLSQTWATELVDLLKEASNFYAEAMKQLAYYWSRDNSLL